MKKVNKMHWIFNMGSVVVHNGILLLYCVKISRINFAA